MSNSVFRKVSLERLSSPEQLDKLLKITSPRGWIALSTIIVIIGTAIIWGYFGSIPVKVDTSGILISSGGTVTVYSSTAGTVSDIRVKNGNNLKKGDIIAIIGENTLSDEIEDLNELIAVLSSLEPGTHWGSITLPSGLEEIQTLGLQVQSQIEVVATAEQNMIAAQKKYEPYQDLYEAGAVSQAELDNQRNIYNSSRDDYEQRALELNQLTAKFQSLKQTDLKKYREALEKKQESLLNDYLIISPEDGKVMNVAVQQGSVVAAGTRIATVAKMGSGVKALEAIIYVPVSDGKKIKEGMEVKIYPSTITKEEYGHMKGTVSEVPQYPVTSETVMSTLGNEALAETLTQKGAPLEVRVDMVTDSATVSGFAWSSQKGAGLNVENGTLCSASVVVDSQRPISLVIPLLKEKYLPIE
ncbi:MAG: NHLP bacteriocin system secretion protein [Firmicutes bacterium]|nr:NHLP bacteriocin system secretion protein [Bacillota bacterium]